MDDPNQITIKAYNQEASKYISETPHTHQPHHKSMLEWIDTALTDLPGHKVLEIGSATSRDATYIRSKGFSVTTSDATSEFVRLLREKGEDTLLLNALTDPLPEGYSLIFANAVAPHFTTPDLLKFLTKANGALQPGSRLAFNLKTGSGEDWVNEKRMEKRYIHYWQPDDIKQLLSEQNFKIIFFDSDATGDLPTHHWINIVVEKQ